MEWEEVASSTEVVAVAWDTIVVDTTIEVVLDSKEDRTKDLAITKRLNANSLNKVSL